MNANSSKPIADPVTPLPHEAFGRRLGADELASLRKGFDADGYVVVRGLLPRDFIDSLSAAVGRMLEARDTTGAIQSAYQADGRARLHKISNLMFTHPAFEALSRNDALLDVVESLIGPGALRFRDVTIVRPGKTDAAISWHQDSAYWDVEPRALVSAWVPLVDVPADSSCLLLVPGTHHRAIEHRLRYGSTYLPKFVSRTLRKAVSMAGTGDARGRSGGNPLLWDLKRIVLASATRVLPGLYGLQDYHVPADVIATLGRQVQVTAERGDVVLFHSLALHASGPNRLGTPRLTTVLSYAPAGATVIGRTTTTLQPARRDGST